MSQTPLKASRMSTWGSQSNLLSPQTANPAQAVAPKPDLPSGPATGGAHQDGQPASLPAEGLQQAIEPGGLPVNKDIGASGQAVAGIVGNPAVLPEPDITRLSHQPGAETAAPAMPLPGVQNQLSSLPEADAARPMTPPVSSAAVAGDLSGGKEAFARPLQALISTVAKVGIRPAPGFMLGSDVRRSKRIPDRAGTASPQLPASSAQTFSMQMPHQSTETLVAHRPARQGPSRVGSSPDSIQQADKGVKPEQHEDATPEPLISLVPRVPSALRQGQHALPATLAQQVSVGSKRPRRSSTSLKDLGRPQIYLRAKKHTMS